VKLKYFLQTFGFLTVATASLASEVPAQEISELNRSTRGSLERAFLAQTPNSRGLLEVTGVKLSSMENGLEILLETSSSGLQPLIIPEENTLVIWLILTAFTGVMMIYWTPFENTVYWLTGEHKALEITASPADGRSPMAINALLEKALIAFPDAELYKFYPPKKPEDLFLVWSQFPDENDFNRDIRLSLDPYTGAIERVEDARKASLATRILNAQYTLHIGHYGGLMTRWLYLLVGLGNRNKIFLVYLEYRGATLGFTDGVALHVFDGKQGSA
jgi:hypothetical protein